MTETDKTSFSYPSGNKASRSRAFAALVTIACGVLLAGGSCFGDIANGGRANWMKPIFGLGFVIGVLLTLAGILWGVVAFVLHVFGSKRE